MARGRSKYYVRKRPNRRRRSGPPTGLTPALLGDFLDPQVSAFMSYLMRRDAKQARARQANAGIRVSSDFMGYDIPKWAIEAHDQAQGIGMPDNHWYTSPLNTTIDVLSRPFHAVAEGTKDFSEQFTDVIRGGSLSNQLQDIGDMFRAGGAGAWQGLSGEADTSFAEVLRSTQANPISAGWGIGVEHVTGFTPPGTTPKWWREHNKTTATVGLAGDIALDPTTYIGIGAVGKFGTGARRFKDLATVNESVRGSKDLVKNLMKEGVVKNNEGDALIRQLTGWKFRKGFQKQAGAAAFEGAVARKSIELAKEQKAKVFKQTFDDTLENLTKLNTKDVTSFGGIKMKQAGALRDRKGKFLNLKQISLDVAKQAGDQTEQLTVKTLLDNYRTIINADYKRTLGIGTRTHRIPLLPSRASEELAKIAQFKPIAITTGKIQQGLRNSYKVVEDVFRVKVEGMHLGRSAAFLQGRYIEDTYKTINKENRRVAWVLGLRRDTTNGELLVRAPGAPEKEDAAVLFSRHVSSLDERVRGDMGELPFTPQELNRELAPGLPEIFRKKNQKEIAAELGYLTKNGKFQKGKKAEIQQAWEDQEWVRSSLLAAATDGNIKGLKDGGHALWMAVAAMEHAVARRKMLETMAESFGFSTKLAKTDEVAGMLIKDLERRGWRETKGAGVSQLKGTVFNPQVAEGIERILKTMDSQREWGKFAKFFNRITNPWKFWVTQPNLGYHIRNTLGDAFINWIDGAVNPADYRAAARMLGWNFSGMKKFEHVTETETPLLRMGGDPMENALHVKNKPLFKNSSNLIDADGRVKPYVLDSEMYAGMNKHGIRQNYAASEFGELESEINTFGTRLSDERHKIEKPFRSFSEQREDFMRMAHFIHLVRTNPTKARTLDEAMEWAGERVRMTHFDYTDFTKFEQQVMSNVFPFYKWTRKALPLMARFMFEHPGKVIVPDKITNSLAGFYGYWPTKDDPLPGIDYALVPDWLKEGGYEPGYDTPGTGNPMFLRVPSPFSDILSFQANSAVGTGRTGIADTLLSQANPLIRIPVEELTNHQSMFAGQNVPIDDQTLYATNQIPFPYIRQGLSAAGFRREGEGNWGPMATSLTGLYSRELTERDQRNQLYSMLFSGNLTPQQNAQVRQILKYRFGVDFQ